MNKIDEKILQYKEDMIKSIERLVNIPSIEGASCIDAPFGEFSKKALLEALDISKEMGFKTKNIQNAIGYAEYGDGEDYVGIIGHVDVVPANEEDWITPPFKMDIRDGKLYGRGVLDNKGPIISCLYALKIVKDLNIPLSKRVRIIFGSNEETGFKDIPYYLINEKPPISGFTPDCKFPAVYGERGILDITICSKKLSDSGIKSINGGFRSNVVPDFIQVDFKDGKSITNRGKTAPGNAPESGINAITSLCESLRYETSLCKEEREFFNFIYKVFHKNYDLSNIGIECRDEISGSLVTNPYSLKLEDGMLKLSVVFRYPMSYSYKSIMEIIGVLSEYSIIENRRMDSVFFDKNAQMLKVMKDAYEEVTGEDGTPVTTTGGTYAKVMPNIVAFGPSFPGQKGIAHNSNEYMIIEDLINITKIYVRAIIGLAN